MTCGLIDLPCHLEAWLWGLIGAVPLWAWLLLALLVVGIVWRLAGWPGLVALAGIAGFVLGRRDEPLEFRDDMTDADASPSPKRPKPRKRTPPTGGGSLTQ